jgi:hypothetical protein
LKLTGHHVTGVGPAPLQCLFANRSAEIALVMQILNCDLLHQFGQIILLALCRFDDDAAGLFAY